MNKDAFIETGKTSRYLNLKSFNEALLLNA